MKIRNPIQAIFIGDNMIIDAWISKSKRHMEICELYFNMEDYPFIINSCFKNLASAFGISLISVITQSAADFPILRFSLDTFNLSFSLIPVHIKQIAASDFILIDEAYRIRIHPCH